MNIIRICNHAQLEYCRFVVLLICHPNNITILQFIVILILIQHVYRFEMISLCRFVN